MKHLLFGKIVFKEYLIRLLVHGFDSSARRVVHFLEGFIPFQCDGGGARYGWYRRYTHGSRR